MRIIRAICNKYRPPLSSGDEENDMQTAAKMRDLSTQTNLLQTEVESNNLQKKRYVWRKIDYENFDVPDFHEQKRKSGNLLLEFTKLSWPNITPRNT